MRLDLYELVFWDTWNDSNAPEPLSFFGFLKQYTLPP